MLWKELEDRLYSCITYAEDFVREFGVKRDLNFQWDGCYLWFGKKMRQKERYENYSSAQLLLEIPFKQLYSN